MSGSMIHVLDQRVEALGNEVAPTVAVAGLSHPDRGQHRARIAPQRFVGGVMSISLHDGVQAIREVAATRLQPGQQQSGTLAKEERSAAMLLTGRFPAHAVRVAFDPARVVALESNGAHSRQVAQGPNDAGSSPVEVQGSGPRLRRVVLRVQQPASFQFVELGLGCRADAFDRAVRQVWTPGPDGQSLMARRIEEFLHAAKPKRNRTEPMPPATVGGHAYSGVATGCHSSARTTDFRRST